MSEVSASDIESKVAAALTEAEVAVQLDGNRVLIEVASPDFSSMSRVQRQQAVYACIEEYIADGRLHAVTIRANAPA